MKIKQANWTYYLNAKKRYLECIISLIVETEEQKCVLKISQKRKSQKILRYLANMLTRQYF